jgi:hypothetical protein
MQLLVTADGLGPSVSVSVDWVLDYVNSKATQFSTKFENNPHIPVRISWEIVSFVFPICKTGEQR